MAPRDLKKAAEGPDPHRAALATHLSNAIRVESRRWTLSGVLIPLVLAAVWIGAQVFVHRIGMHRMPGVKLVVFWGGMFALVLVSHALARRRVARELAATAVAEGLCGSCCYGLRDIPVEADGCLVCPECGAAWRRERITRPHWLVAADARRSRAEGGRARAGWLLRFVTGTPSPAQLLGPDDRGRFVSVVDSRLLLADTKRREELGADRCRMLRQVLRRVGAVPRLFVALIPGGLVLIQIIALINVARDGDGALTAILVAGIGLFSAVTAGMLLGHGFYDPRRAARALVAEGSCASCLRSLRELTPESDGCVVCPECGGSWRAPGGPAVDPAPKIA